MELSFLHWLRDQIPPAPHIPLGIGDDAALLNQQTGKQTVVTTDMLMDGVDFILKDCGPFAAGRKALAVNLSDLAAMGAKPVAAFVSLALHRDQQEAESLSLAKQLIQGMLPLANEFGCDIAGGDTNTWLGPLAINITAIGEVDAGTAWLRSGARPGDAILVTGDFGASLRYGRHLTFTPRVREALHLRSLGSKVHAAIDVSDGLSLDLSRICSASKCGARIEKYAVPIHPHAEGHIFTAEGTFSIVEPEKDPFDMALSDGEDFELILAVPPHDAKRLQDEQPFSAPLTIIGTFTAEPGLTLQLPDGRVLPLPPRGYEH
jgi:thiamine-monophosphate kinase